MSVDHESDMTLEDLACAMDAGRLTPGEVIEALRVKAVRVHIAELLSTLSNGKSIVNISNEKEQEQEQQK